MDAGAVELIHSGATIMLAVLTAFVIRPLSTIAGRLGRLETRLAYIEGKLEGAGVLPLPVMTRPGVAAVDTDKTD